MSRPRIAFIGTGWIGRNRMETMLATGLVEACAICEPLPEAADNALKLVPNAIHAASLEDVLALEPDGVVIATPSALHAEQSIRALQAGAAVFCQKPLGRTAAEVRAVLVAAEAADGLLALDMSYRFTEGMRVVAEQVRSGTLGDIHSVNLVFHNAYGPDKPWFYDPTLSGGGCLIDLGVHLVDLALWALGFPAVTVVAARIRRRPGSVEDHAVAMLDLDGVTLQLACSWHLPAGQDAVIAAEFYGTKGGAAFRNVGGSFYDFTAERFEGTQRQRLASPPDAWGGRAAADWIQRLVAGAGYEGVTDGLLPTAETIDLIYEAAGRSCYAAHSVVV